MKLTCTGADLHRAAAWTAKIAPSNPSSPVLAGVRLTAEDGLTLAATDFETFGTATCAAIVQDGGSTVVSARLLAAVAKMIPAKDDVALVSDGSRLEIRHGRSRWALPEMETDLWPTFPSVGEPIGKMSGAVLSRALDRVLPACGAPDVKPPILSGVLVEFGEGLTLTATDRYRIATVELPWQPAIEGSEPIVIPATVLGHAAAESEVDISTENGVVGIRSGGFTVLGRLLADKYPPVRDVAAQPKAKAETTATVNVQALRDAIDGVAIVLGTDESHLLIGFSEDGVDISPVVAGKNNGEADSQVDLIAHTGPAIQVKVKHQIVADALRCLDSPLAVFTFTGSARAAFVAEPADENGSVTDTTYSHVMMPMAPPRPQS